MGLLRGGDVCVVCLPAWGRGSGFHSVGFALGFWGWILTFWGLVLRVTFLSFATCCLRLLT